MILDFAFVNTASVCMLSGGGWEGWGTKLVFSELIKVKITKQVTLSVVVFPCFLFGLFGIFRKRYPLFCNLLLNFSLSSSVKVSSQPAPRPDLLSTF